MNERSVGRSRGESAHCARSLLAAALLCLITLSGCWQCEAFHEWDHRVRFANLGWSEEELIRNNGEPDFRVAGSDRLAESLSDVELRLALPAEQVRSIPEGVPLDIPYRDFIMRCFVQGDLWEGVTGGRRPYDKDWYLKPPATTDVFLIYAEDEHFRSPFFGVGFLAHIHVFREGKLHHAINVFRWNSSLLRDAPARSVPRPEEE